MFTVRDFSNHELDFLTDMLYESIHIPENKPEKMALLNLPHLKKYHENWGRIGDTALIALDSHNQAMGAVWYRLFNEANKGYGYVDSNIPELGIAICQEARGLGLGTLLMQSIMQKARQDGYTSISLSVDPENHTAVHLYKKLDFEDFGISGTSITMIKRFYE
ncbi:GNAT family N-acetyltransferase [Metasolibacillus meyeri]|uniref:GNAT family N-acetyltransferase n=1 Tax=Metasolibacillus meyeri TaxID=1071052 RepID=A0AAW9NXW0_9BACL|nr:GNAT family N-acetyltransferase [Metasolibacillus meyeri]MEC1180146.1 GNAT family N-acetyltransferase [Metasolibacillus meyeri]